ncbi:MAG: GNAT family protein [Burkholderiaceae bacterium]
MNAPARNALGQPVGAPLPGWKAPPRPQRVNLEGRYCRVEPLAPERHGESLWQANSLDAEGRNWTYLGSEPFVNRDDYIAWLGDMARLEDPLYFAICDTDGDAIGVATLMRITPDAGSIEVGNINFSPRLQRQRAATEAMYLMMRYAFDLGYRRYEWKCDSLNAPSRAAAERLGFQYEGLFRQALVYKNRSRDTAWYSIIDGDWPARRDAFEAWLAPENFDADGRQRKALVR